MEDKKNIKDYKKFLSDERGGIRANIIKDIEKFPKKLKLNKLYKLYDSGLETAISNGEIRLFYENYYRNNFKKYVKSIPFPFEKLTPENTARFDKLNKIAHIFENITDVNSKVIPNYCFKLMDMILYDMYFNIKTVDDNPKMRYDIYEKVDELVIPDTDNELEWKRFGLKFLNSENPLNYIIFLSNTNEIIRFVRNYY